MTDRCYSRRTALKLLGTTAVLGSAGTVAADEHGDRPNKGKLKKLGHSLLSDPPGGYAEGAIRSDGQYGVLGSFLVDLSNPRDPTEVHRVPSSSNTRNADVKFDSRDGLYYRTQEPNNADGEGGIEVIDYGWGDGSPEEPVILSKLDAQRLRTPRRAGPLRDERARGRQWPRSVGRERPGRPVTGWLVRPEGRPPRRRCRPRARVRPLCVHRRRPRRGRVSRRLRPDGRERPGESGSREFVFRGPDWDDELFEQDFDDPDYLGRLFLPPGNAHYAQPPPDGDYVYVGAETFPGSVGVSDPDEDDFGGIKVFDTSDLSNPEFVTRIDPPSVDGFRTSHNFDVTDNRLHISWYEGGARVFDSSDPANPEERAAYNPDGSSFWTAVSARGMTVASDIGGGLVFLNDDRGDKRPPSFGGEMEGGYGPGPDRHTRSG